MALLYSGESAVKIRSYEGLLVCTAPLQPSQYPFENIVICSPRVNKLFYWKCYVGGVVASGYAKYPKLVDHAKYNCIVQTNNICS